jgi:hypothetical protein
MQRSVRRTTIPDVLDVALELERKTMALYAEFVRIFADDPELRQFWFHMARHEAAHCGALMLVDCVLRNDPELGGETKVLFDTSTGIRLRSLLAGYRRELRRGVTRERAFEMAVDLESSELEDVVVDLLQVVQDPGWRDQAVKMLIHDLSDMSYMIEKHTKDERLLARADALVERRIGRRGTTPAAARSAARRRASAARRAR